jgi:hypothetical protein
MANQPAKSATGNAAGHGEWVADDALNDELAVKMQENVGQIPTLAFLGNCWTKLGAAASSRLDRLRCPVGSTTSTAAVQIAMPSVFLARQL